VTAIYWVYRYGERNVAAAKWRMSPHVRCQNAFHAIRAAALVFQRERCPEEPIALSLVQVRPAPAAYQERWIVEHDEGSCLLADPSDRGKQLKRVATACDYWVQDPETVVVGLPTCELCRQLLMTGVKPMEIKP
jgi:hypothetical protein